MNFDKDHYATLGCTPNAEQSVIQAAYRALAKRHHPDANKGSDESKIKFQEIQEAYEVLNDPTKRAYYDSMRTGTSGREYAPGEDHGNDQNSEDLAQNEKWQVISNYFPHIEKLADELGNISPNLKRIFQLILIENRNFNEADRLAKNIEEIYIETYFGYNQKIKNIAKRLLRHKKLYRNAEALHELNKIIAALGEEAPHDTIIINLRIKYDLWWTVYKNIKPISSDELLNSKEWKSSLPNSLEAWSAIESCCINYGWLAGGYKLLRLGRLFTKFNPNINFAANDHKYFRKPEEARQAMGIPIADVISARTHNFFKHYIENSHSRET